MADKKIHQILNFEGGLNDNTDRMDIADNELSLARDVMVDTVGRLRVMGTMAHDSTIYTVSWQQTVDESHNPFIVPGHGTYIFNSSYTGAVQASIDGFAISTAAIAPTGAKYFIAVVGEEENASSTLMGTASFNIAELGAGAFNASPPGIAILGRISEASSISTDVRASSADFFEADGNLRVHCTSLVDYVAIHWVLMHINRPRSKNDNEYTINQWLFTPGSPQSLHSSQVSIGWQSSSVPTYQGKVNIWFDIATGLESDDGSLIGEGWEKSWEFALSETYDGNQESPLTTGDFIFAQGLDEDGDDNQGIISIAWIDTAAVPFWLRVTHINVYMREVGTTDFFHQYSCDLYDGVTHPETGYSIPIEHGPEGANNTANYVTVPLSQPRTEETYFSRTGVSQDTGDYGMLAQFKTAVVANGRTYIGNVRYLPKALSGDVNYMVSTASDSWVSKKDAMIKSPLHQYDVFSEERLIETAVGQGGEIIKLASYADRLLQFRKNALVIYNISQDLEMVEEIFDYKGVSHPNAVCTTSNGIFWANEYGCHLFDGTTVIDLFSQKGWRVISEDTWSNFFTSDTITGYYPKGDYVVIFSDSSGVADGANMIYHMLTKSFTEGNLRITSNASISNLVTDEENGDLILNSNLDWTGGYDAGSNSTGDWKTLWKWSNTGVDSTAYAVKTKMIDFGNSARRKKIKKIYVTHRNAIVNRIKLRGEIQAKSGTDQSEGSVSDNFLLGGFVPSSHPNNWITQEFTMPTTDEGSDALNFNEVYGIRLYIEADAAQTAAVENGEIFHTVTTEEAVYTTDENNTESDIPSFTEKLLKNNIIPGEAVVPVIVTANGNSSVGTCTYTQLDETQGILGGALTGTLDLTNGVVKAKVTVGAAVADDYISIAYTHGASAVPGNFEVNDITIVYQEKRVS